MDRGQLQQHVRELAALEETDAPVVSCYLNLEQGWTASKVLLDTRLQILRNIMPRNRKELLDQAVMHIEEFMRLAPLDGLKGLALFSRGGSEPFFLPLRFQVPVPTWVSADYTPNIFHLVELKDSFDRYVIMLSTSETVRILEVNLGEITLEMWSERPELRKRVGREWTKAHYQAHRREQTDRFLKEKVKVLDQLMQKTGHTQLILAGDARLVARVRELLPKRLLDRLVDTVSAAGKGATEDVVEATLSAFVEYEQKQSHAAVESLVQELHTDGLAVSGWEASRKALLQGQVDSLIISQQFDPPAVWQDPESREVGRERTSLAAALDVPIASLRELNVREELVRLAEASGCKIETVDHSEALEAEGGVGCLLRYRT